MVYKKHFDEKEQYLPPRPSPASQSSYPGEISTVLLVVTNLIEHAHNSIADLVYLYHSLPPPSKAQPFYI